MIAHIAGTIIQSTEKSCVVLTASGVGYELFLTEPERLRLSDMGREAAFFVQTVVREDALDLYGFATWDERRAFSILLGVPKLGPRTALAMLGHFTPREIAELTARDDEQTLTRVPGIGPKSARRILIDLKGRLNDFLDPEGPRIQAAQPPGSVLADTVSALASLGYSNNEAGPAVRAVLEQEPDLDVAAAVRAALKKLSRAGS
jgi:Holliday junction DNA helicase RuvA